MSNRPPLRVCIDARVKSTGNFGGVEQFVIGLATGLSKLEKGPEEYIFIGHEGRTDWLEPHISPPCRIHIVPLPLRWKIKQDLGSAPSLVRRARRWWKQNIAPGIIAIPSSDGTIERLKADIMHFTTQHGFLTKVPSIYHPHDLQHLHLPEFFTPRQRLVRERRYRVFCEQAQLVAVSSSWTKADVVAHYQLPEDKVKVVPLAPPTNCYPTPSQADLALVRREFDLPERFIFYPAQTWPHKNHIGLLKALATLRDQHGLTVPLVSSGKRNDFFPTIQACIQKLSLEGQVRFLGFVSPLQLQCLYRLCRATVIPTKFEAGSFPMWEAATAESPVACSNVTALPEQAGDSALIFDPDDSDGIANAIGRLWKDDALSATLTGRARERVARFTWERTARHFRAYYRSLCGQPLGPKDCKLLEARPTL